MAGHQGVGGVIALLGALQAEVYHTVRRIEGAEHQEWAGRRITIGTLGGQRVVCTWTGSGIALSALTSQYICSRFQPKAILLAGIGAALNPKYRLQDAVIAEDVVQWDIDTSAIGGGPGVFPGRQKDNSQLREMQTHPSLKERLLEAAERHSDRSSAGSTVHTGRFLSGDSFLPVEEGSQLREKLRNGLQGDLADMESSSVILAGLLNQIPSGVVRIVSDTGQGGRPENFRAFLDRSSISCADIMVHVLESLTAKPL
ncbi:MAG: 5'-methylthioadenosine/S-adenosylhomocysteine nucleosidase [Spirochaetaceae bacterium]|nr:5'-methylthioadenosine/S-adenosylhomocysteine nucleosidase [Spirochaetaceae bacterium]MCF7948806.1 5'-methylthioadenosine/S-adenosylhomocysteine nucleosidase [Spirochaetia bacterium]MCF7950463.1 5'-methylthioadenosine/S-adenosylhomocysteine nucleosidase [Spirochaetaceae bacterium]